MAMNFVVGSSEGIIVPNHASLTLASSNITLSAWAKPVPGATRQMINKNATTTPNTQYQLRLQKSGAPNLKVRFSFQDVSHTPATNVNNNQWNHVVGTYDGTDLRIYLDGAFDSLLNSSGLTMTDNGQPVGLGFNGNDQFLPMDGDMDDLRIYDRALSAAEILTLFTLRGKDDIINGLVSRWTMREREPGIGPTAAGSIKDIGPSGNDGNPTNTPTYTDGILSFGRGTA